MKAILKFKLPEEQEEYQIYINATKMHSVLWEMDQWLRKETKYNVDNLSEDTYEAFIECRKNLISLLNENNIEL